LRELSALSNLTTLELDAQVSGAGRRESPRNSSVPADPVG